MGTNYYAIQEQRESVCPHCERPGYIESVRLHIGKSSYGWCFSLHVASPHEPHLPRDLDEWRQFWKTCVGIEDEYGQSISIEQMEKIITGRKWQGDSESKNAEWFRSNHAQPGPNGLARHKLDGHCIAHGDGTYDLITGQFS